MDIWIPRLHLSYTSPYAFQALFPFRLTIFFFIFLNCILFYVLWTSVSSFFIYLWIIWWICVFNWNFSFIKYVSLSGNEQTVVWNIDGFRSSFLFLDLLRNERYFILWNYHWKFVWNCSWLLLILLRWLLLFLKFSLGVRDPDCNLTTENNIKFVSIIPLLENEFPSFEMLILDKRTNIIKIFVKDFFFFEKFYFLNQGHQSFYFGIWSLFLFLSEDLNYWLSESLRK